MFRLMSISVILSCLLLNCGSDRQEAPQFTEEEFWLTVWDGVRLDCSLFLPVGEAHPNGFPLVIPVHGGGGNKTRVYAWRDTLIQHGYAVFAYSCRGQGKSEGAQNVEGTYRIQDLKFIVDWLRTEADKRGTIDKENIGTMGRSQGGQHGWMAVCFEMPIKTAILGNASTSPLVFNNCIGRIWMRSYQSPNTRADAARDTIVTWMRNRDRAALLMRPRMKFIRENIHRISVPVFLTTAWLDQAFWGNLYLEHYEKIKAPKKMYIGTGGHGSESVQSVWDWRLAQNIRWFDYWLKGIDNGIMDEPPIAYAADTNWDDVHYTSSLPPAGTKRVDWYIGSANRLSPAPPSRHVTYTIKQTRTDPAYDYADYFPRDQSVKPVDAFRVEPLFLTTEPFLKRTEFTGIPQIRLTSSSSVTEYHTHVRLYDVAPGGSRRFITRANYAILDNTPGTVNHNEWKGFAISHFFEEGHSLGVEITTLDNKPDGDTFVVPVFNDYDVTISSSPSGDARISIPVIQ